MDPGRDQVVLLGASNLTRSIGSASRIARSMVDHPCELALVLGHGRSYGISSNILGRRLPSILDCNLWSQLSIPDARTEGPRRYALITDVGNDIGFGRLPEEIESWLIETTDRLKRARFDIIMTALPLDSLRKMSRTAFEIIRRLFFPGKPLSYQTALDRVADLDERMRRLADRTSIRFVEQRGDWFGIDPIHIRRSLYPPAWTWIMTHWKDQQPAAYRVEHTDPGGVRLWWSLRLAKPDRRTIFGIAQHGAQPARILADGSRIWLY